MLNLVCYNQCIDDVQNIDSDANIVKFCDAISQGMKGGLAPELEDPVSAALNKFKKKRRRISFYLLLSL